MLTQEIAFDLHRIGAVKFGEFTLKSGIRSPIYIDLRVLVSHPDVLKKIAEAMVSIAKPLKFNRIAGIPYTALPIATAISLQTGWPMVYARKEVKDYGTKKKIEGEFKEGETVLVVDDLITTGDSKFETIAPFKEAGLKVKDVVVLVDREQGGAKLLAQKGYALHSVLGINQLLDTLKEAGKLEESLYQKAREFLSKSKQ